ncbi:MAG: zinc ribbon domain-containing protein [Eggerthellaceae bacterium]|nr:zinc ribbon domain-containing protein [Eggerthellaceae bacterium]
MACCTQCGTELSAGLRFCPECGTAVAAGQQPAVEPASQVDPVGAQPPASSAEGTQAGQRASGPSIAAEVKGVVDAVEAAIPELPSTGGVVEALASAEVGKVTLSTWKSVPPAAQAVGAAVGQAQKAAKTAKNSPVAKKSKLPIVLVAVGAAILVAAFALYVVPLFIPHPYDPNSHVALTSSSSSSASGSSTSSTSSSEGSSGSSSSSSNGSASSSASASSSSSSASSSSSTSGGSPTATGSYSTDERPTINDFKWMTGETDKGNAPAGVARITDFGAVMGGWKAYMYGGNLERLLNVSIDAGQSGAQVTLDWYYIRDNKQDKVFEDTTPSSSFTGSFDGGMLDATGSGRITLTAFWEKDGHQYATGSFIWPSGETDTIALVRP